MKKEVLYSLKGIYRENFEIEGYRFGHGEKSACIVGAMRGNEIQQLYICSQLIKVLKDLEMRGAISHNHEILVIPSANRFSMNVEKRFWPVDNTDINRMFPGDEAGDTTKQIAAAIFESSKGYSYGIQFASFYMPGDFIPHVRMMETGYQSASLANLFGLQYVVIRKPKPMDTATLNYSLIPILAGVTQFISVKVAQSGQNTEVDDDNPMAASMKMTMYIMPLMSAFIAISVPAGLGLYWIATAVVQTIITVFINRYYDKLGADEIVKRNVEKRNKKRAKKGLPPEKIAKNATTSTKNMSASREKAVKSLEQIKAENEKKVQEIKESSKYYKTAKPGSLAEKAGMVAKYNEKNTKNGGKKN